MWDFLCVQSHEIKSLSECVQSFGENCEHPCNIDCKIQACNRFNGSCLFGCKTGKQCEQGNYLLLLKICIFSKHAFESSSFFSLTNICTNNTFVIDNDLLIISLFPQVCLKVTQLNNRPHLRHFGLLAFLYYLSLTLFSLLLLFGSGKMYSKHVIFWLDKYSSDTKLICCF